MRATAAGGALAPPVVNQCLRFGAAPRAARAWSLAGKVRAMLEGRANVSAEDVRTMVLPAMRHRLLLNFEGEAEGMSTDTILQTLGDPMHVDVGVAAGVVSGRAAGRWVLTGGIHH